MASEKGIEVTPGEHEELAEIDGGYIGAAARSAQQGHLAEEFPRSEKYLRPAAETWTAPLAMK